jgi:hypothetical protein
MVSTVTQCWEMAAGVQILTTGALISILGFLLIHQISLTIEVKTITWGLSMKVI